MKATMRPPGAPARRETIELLVKEHEAYVRSLALRLSPDPAEADDIAQEAFLIAFRKLDMLDVRRDLRPWLAATVRNLSHRAWEEALRNQRLKRDALAEYLEILAEEPSGLYAEPAKAALRNCLMKLPERSRTLLNLRYNMNLTSEAIAGQITTSAEAVRMALVRTRELLRACIGRALGGAGA
jgi:RNA polymerase sigma-70 factor (ECF subfamily)